MKDLSISLLSILFFIAATAHAASPLVYDTDGDPLQPGVEYHVRYSLWPGGGGVSRWYNGTCPCRVIQMPSGEQRGQPVTFAPKRPIVGGGIPESTDVYIKFTQTIIVVPGCPGDDDLWRVSREPSLGQLAITTGGRIGDFLSEFRIVAAAPLGFSYKLVKCFTSLLCRSVGTVFLEEHTHLVLNNNVNDYPLTVIFSKANPAKSSPPATQVAK